jgi:multidrug efflux pump subunit AcrA (membrane-fusion protein)
VLKAGTPVKVTVALKTVQDALVVPTAAIVTDSAGKKQVMIIAPDSTAHHREVELGISQDDKTQIAKGLQVGEKVISSGAYALEDGTKVKIGAADDKDAGDAKPSAAKDGGKD